MPALAPALAWVPVCAVDFFRLLDLRVLRLLVVEAVTVAAAVVVESGPVLAGVEACGEFSA